MELFRQPKKKHLSRSIKAYQPFPIPIESECDEQLAKNLWTEYTGIFSGDHVAICHQGEMANLSNKGFFGKGSLSRGHPTFNLRKNGVPPFIYGRQWERRKKWIKSHIKISQKIDNESVVQQNKDDVIVKEKNFSTNTPKLNNVDSHVKKSEDISLLIVNDQSLEDDNNDECVVIDDNNSDEEAILSNPKISIESEPIKTVQEELHTTLEEAFFLSYALGCLKIFDWSGKFLTLTNMWCLFKKTQTDFIENYIAYHYFRAKGWIVKPGHKFGGDLILYKQGPPFYHASYVVIIESVKDNNRSSENLSWDKLQGLNRVVEAAGKEVLLCQIFWPDHLDLNELDSPQVLPKFEVNEVLLRRWVPSEEREL
uniref:tRNA-splicing endonuclease subunit Sen2 n=2 Tax=Clastoptera arizonana TaxID=38151 RepID=A0A1B6CGZ8_9HEMI